MRIDEIEQPAKPKTPDQQRVAGLQANSNRAQQAVKAERARQQLLKAQQGVAKAAQPTPAITQQVSRKVIVG